MNALALTIHQPWAWAIVAGHKPVENRTWIPPRAFIGSVLFIHAGKSLDMPAVAKVKAEIGIAGALLDPARDLVTGAIVGCARYMGTATEDASLRVPGVEVQDAERYIRSPWYSGPFGWVLSEPVKFAKPVPARGMQKLWSPDHDVLEACRSEYRRSR